jgi:hypothetical protein
MQAQATAGSNGHPAGLVDQGPPYDADAEAHVLASLLVLPAELPNVNNLRTSVVASLSDDDFFLPQHRAVFGGMKRLVDADKPLDLLLLANEIKTAGDWELVGGTSGLHKLIATEATGAHVEYYADILRDKRRERRNYRFALRLNDQVRDALPWNDVQGFIAQYLEDVATERLVGEQRFQMLTPAELASISPDVPYLIPNALPEAQPGTFVAGSKMLKTTLACDQIIAGALGGAWCGYFRAARLFRSWFLSGESGDATIAETCRRIALKAGKKLEDIKDFRYGATLPQLSNPADVAELGRMVRGEGIESLLLDPLMLMADFGGREGSIFAFGPMGRRVAEEICGKSKCALTIIHHATQAKAKAKDYSPPSLNDASWAGIEQFSRFWILLNRREAYQDGSGQHRLWLSTGGSAGHGGLFHLDIDEGTRATPGGRFWDARVTPANEAESREADRRAAAASDRENRVRHEHQRKIVEALTATPSGETKRTLRSLTGLNEANFGQAVLALMLAGEVEQCEVRKHTAMHDGYRLKTTPKDR